MNAPLSGWVAGAGLLGLAVLLYFMQRLRVRQTPLVVETTLFWREVLDDTRARIFVQRFRHPWVYALLLGIVSLLWLSFAQLEPRDESGGRHIVLLSPFSLRSAADRDALKNAILDSVEAMPASRRQVLFCGDELRTLLLPDEDTALLQRRLEDLEDNGHEATLLIALEDLRPFLESGDTLHVAGDLKISGTFENALSEGVKIEAMDIPGERPAAGIKALGWAAAASGRWGFVDILVRIDDQGDGRAVPAAFLEDRPWGGTVEPGRAAGEMVFRDVPATGEVFRVHPRGAAPRSLTLPDRKPVGVWVAPGIPAVLVRAVKADPGLAVVPRERARVLIVPTENMVEDERPVLSLCNEEEQVDAILAMGRLEERAEAVLDSLFYSLGLAEIDASDLASARGRRVTMGCRPGSRRRLSLWKSLVSDEFNFIHSRAFPLFVGAALRWLNAVPEPPQFITTGEPLHEVRGALTSPAGVPLDPLGDSFVPLGEKPALTSGRKPLFALPLDSRDIAGDPATLSAAAAAGFHMSMVTAMLLLAFFLLGLEWVLYRKGRIP